MPLVNLTVDVTDEELAAMRADKAMAVEMALDLMDRFRFAARDTIHVFEMLERVLSTITSADLKQHFLAAPVEFQQKLGLNPAGIDEAYRKKEMQTYAARLFTMTAALLAESFDGFVPSITSTADGFVILMEQDVRHEGHRQDPKMLPTTTHVIEGGK